jgi:hypothetical protein
MAENAIFHPVVLSLRFNVGTNGLNAAIVLSKSTVGPGSALNHRQWVSATTL